MVAGAEVEAVEVDHDLTDDVIAGITVKAQDDKVEGKTLENGKVAR